MELDALANMTEIGLVKTITISYFKTHISEELRRVRRGARIIISDRDTPIAEVVPFRTTPELLSIRQPQVAPFQVPGAAFKIDHDPLEYLLEDREKR